MGRNNEISILAILITVKYEIINFKFPLSVAHSYQKFDCDKSSDGGTLFVMKHIKDLTGLEFGYLKVLSLYGRQKSGTRWNCLCKCGNTKIINKYALLGGTTLSCGCYHKEKTSQAKLKHGRRHTTEYNSWSGMKDRCYNKNSHKYYAYGARGITVCDRWLNSFENFFEDMGEKPSPKHTLDRIEVNGNYEDKNCRWALPTTQARNKQENHLILFEGKNLTMAEWSEITGIAFDTILARINYYGWSIKDALTIKDGRKTKRVPLVCRQTLKA